MKASHPKKEPGAGTVTAICPSESGRHLLVGFESGHLEIFDMQLEANPIDSMR
ncbi:unnamed protein product [Protopolystoma xenopodis]|uniref:Anaphase-promoting complex subunit 4 WD40 domain-containing protein n=1 Tax=Protopolystoma xenopodis TaxID=117903 RepID=A0A3S5CS55_9PLAT|nr:unnamed protein product [Protopolystoma xenopodis]